MNLFDSWRTAGFTQDIENGKHSPAKFDQFSTEYSTLVDESVLISGENSAYFSEYKALYIARLLGRSFAGRVLDYGCGVGVLSGFLKRHMTNATIDGFDVSASSIAKVPADLKEQGYFSSDISGCVAGYDVVVIANVMHHVPPKERQQVMAEIATRLAKGGKAVLFEHNPLNPLTQWAVKHCPFDDDAILLRPKEAAGHFERAGLKIARRDYIVFFPRLLSLLRRLEPSLGWFPAGAQYALVGEKPI